MESFTGMVSGMMARFASDHSESSYFLDPITYVFSKDPQYIRSWKKADVEVARAKLAEDLGIAVDRVQDEWIREVPVEEGKQPDPSKVQIFSLKKSYKSLGAKVLPEGLAHRLGLRPISLESLAEGRVAWDLSERVSSYQRSSIVESVEAERLSGVTNMREPDLVLSPYFYIDEKHVGADLPRQEAIWRAFADCQDAGSAAIVLHTCAACMGQVGTVAMRVARETGIGKIAVWIDDLDEVTASVAELGQFREFVEEAASSDVYLLNLYGGSFSTLLLGWGLGALVLSPGYGEVKGSDPVIGGAPTPKYYFPPLQYRMSVEDALHACYVSLGKSPSPQRFGDEICSCPICREGLGGNHLALLPYFNELGQPHPRTGRRFPTNRAMQRSAFHYLICRLNEIEYANGASQDELRQVLGERIEAARQLDLDCSHLERWRQALAA